MPLSNIRFLIIFTALAIGIWLALSNDILTASIFFIVATILTAIHFLFNNVSAAFIALKKGDIGQAEKLIHSIKKPEWLLKQHKAYYHFTKGMIATQRNLPKDAINDLKNAIDIGLRTSNDNALAAINIAHTAYNDKNFTLAREFTQKAKSFNSNDLMIKEHITKLEEVLPN